MKISASIDDAGTVYSTQRYFQAIAELGKLACSRYLQTTIEKLDKNVGTEKSLKDEVNVMVKMGFVDETEVPDGLNYFRPAEDYSEDFKAVADYVEKEYCGYQEMSNSVTEKEIEELQDEAGFLGFLI